MVHKISNWMCVILLNLMQKYLTTLCQNIMQNDFSPKSITWSNIDFFVSSISYYYLSCVCTQYTVHSTVINKRFFFYRNVSSKNAEKFTRKLFPVSEFVNLWFLTPNLHMFVCLSQNILFQWHCPILAFFFFGIY